MQYIIRFGWITALLYLSGCATILDEPFYSLPISSNPSEANILIKDEKGKIIYKGKTPAEVKLDKSDGSFTGGKHYLVKFEKPGYKTQVVPVVTRPSNYYLGNLILPFITGIGLVIDPFFGDMYQFQPENINYQLSPVTEINN